MPIQSERKEQKTRITTSRDVMEVIPQRTFNIIVSYFNDQPKTIEKSEIIAIALDR